jgi:cytochrome c oxidase subunit 1
MTTVHETPEHQSFISRYIFSTDHKVIAAQYIITGLIWALVGGLLGLFFRFELTWPESGILSPEAYNASVTLHGAVMVFWVAMPILIGGFANLCIPLMIGAKDMAFPRLNMLSYWVFFISSIILAISFFVPGGPAAYGWTIYPPLSSDPRFTGALLGGVLLILALAFEFSSMLMGGINYIVTTIALRTKGMSMMRLPMMVWMELIASVLFLLSVTPLIAGAVLLLLDMLAGTHFFRVTAWGQGDPVLWQHLFWFFGHPEVYVVLLPGLGIMVDVMTSHSRKPVYGYKSIVYANIAAGILSFVVWAHHMFVAGINPLLTFPFAILTIIISIPFTITLVCFGLTLWGGSIRYTAANLFAIGSFAAFIIGGLTGLFLGGQSTDIYFHDTYFVVAHFHYTLFPTAILAALAGIYHWFPKMFGRMMNEAWGKVHFWGTFIGFNVFAFTLFFLGFAGHPRRYSGVTHIEFLKDFQWIHLVSTAGAILLIAVQIPFIINFFSSMFVGKKAGDNPWRATTLEWLVESPPPHHNWGNMVPVVVNDPYDYSPEGEVEDFRPQGVLTPREKVNEE